MHTNRIPLDDLGGLGIFNLIAKALMVAALGARAPASARRRSAKVPAPRVGLLDRIDRWCWRLSQRALEEHLGQARDVYDLEARIRDLERRLPYRCF